MKRHLEKSKRDGRIDFMEVPLRWGLRHREFVGIDLKTTQWFRIFYDNKYREDKYLPAMEELEKQLSELKKGLKDVGIYNTRKEYEELKNEIDFYKKYI